MTMITIHKPQTRRFLFTCQNKDSLNIIEPDTVTFKVYDNSDDSEEFSQVLDHGVYKKEDNSFYFDYTFETVGEYTVKFIAETNGFKDSDKLIYKVEN